MSRITSRSVDGNQVAFGLDHALGWFFDEWQEDEEGEPEMEIEESSIFSGLSKERLLDLLNTRLPKEEKQRLKNQIGAVALDLDPGEVERCSLKKD